MTGTRKGGLKTTAKIKKERGADWYVRIGAKGGSNGKGPEYQVGGKKASGFAAMTPEQRAACGAKGGVISKPGPRKKNRATAGKLNPAMV